MKGGEDIPDCGPWDTESCNFVLYAEIQQPIVAFEEALARESRYFGGVGDVDTMAEERIVTVSLDYAGLELVAEMRDHAWRVYREEVFELSLRR